MNIDKTTGLPEVPVDGAYWEVRKVLRGDPLPGKPNDIFRLADILDAGYYMILAKDILEVPTVGEGWFRKRTYAVKMPPKQEVISRIFIQTLQNPLEKEDIAYCARIICNRIEKRREIEEGERFLGKYPPNTLN